MERRPEKSEESEGEKAEELAAAEAEAEERGREIPLGVWWWGLAVEVRE